ncbi:MAG: response regulator [Methanospirillum sp.]|nr:response regulator [Methanospirillum sp.]
MGNFEVVPESDPLKASRMDLAGFDAIVSDFEMPEMNGIELLELIRERGISLPFILLTGRGNDAVMLQALNAGAASYLHKTADPRAMFTELAAIIQKEILLNKLKSNSPGSPMSSLGATLFDNLPEPAFAVDLNGCVIAWNKAVQEMTGADESSMIGTGWQQYSLMFGGISRHMAVDSLLDHDSDHLEGYEITLSTSTLIIGKRTVPTPDGSTKTYWEKISLITGSSGSPEGAVVIIRDLTRRRSIIVQNKVLRDQLSAIADSMMRFGTNFEENIDSILSLACRFCGAIGAGYIKKQVRAPDFICIHSAEGHADDEETLRSIISVQGTNSALVLPVSWYTHQYDVTPSEGSYIVLTFCGEEESSFCDAFIRLLIGAIGSEERRYAATEAMNRSKERFRMLFENAPVAIFENDYSGVYQHLQDWNQGGEVSDDDFCLDPGMITNLMREVRLTGMNQESYRLLGSDISSPQESMKILGATAAAQSLFLEACTCIKEKKESFSAYDHLILPNQEERDIYLNWVVPRKNDEYRSVLTSMVDITGQKRIEESLRQANKKLNTLTMISRHDIRNQLTALIGYINLIRFETQDLNVKDWCGRCIRICTRIQNIIAFTKEYEQIGNSDPVWDDLSSLIHSDEIRAGFPTITITVELPDASVYADAMFYLVIWNLIDNVVRHGGHATSVTITGIRDDTGGLDLIIEDNGMGIAESEKEQIFERGYGTNTGLGLFLVREILALTGIQISECGTEGAGAKFLLRVPPESCSYHP